jgi:GGDEF domain-containing protein
MGLPPLVVGPEAAIRRVRTLLRSVERNYSVDSKQIEVGISAGLPLYPDDGQHADELVRHADHALYAANRPGGSLAFIGRPVRDAQNPARRNRMLTL